MTTRDLRTRRFLAVGAAVLMVAVIGSTGTSGARSTRTAGSARLRTTTTSSSTSTTVTSTTPGSTTVLSQSFTRPDGLITNEYAFWNPQATDAATDPVWVVTSGSLFVRNGAAWSGRPDDIAPNATSSNGTDSAILRAITRRRDLTDVTVSLRLRHDSFVTTPSTPATGWDGEHLFLRYVDETSLYSVSFDRRDGSTAIKKKVPGGTSNGGTYYTLASGTDSFVAGSFHDLRATIRAISNGSVTIGLWVDGTLVLSAIDAGVGGPPIPSGGIGIRGDNAEFTFDDLVVTSP